MENWGLVTYRTTAVLFEEGKSDAKYKNRIAYVVAHGTYLTLPIVVHTIFLTQPQELAHQWFGNIVTMDWWNELWLNEGFATWVGWLAVDHFHPGEFSLSNFMETLVTDSVHLPEWNVWSQFVVRNSRGIAWTFRFINDIIG